MGNEGGGIQWSKNMFEGYHPKFYSDILHVKIKFRINVMYNEYETFIKDIEPG